MTVDVQISSLSALSSHWQVISLVDKLNWNAVVWKSLFHSLPSEEFELTANSLGAHMKVTESSLKKQLKERLTLIPQV